MPGIDPVNVPPVPPSGPGPSPRVAEKPPWARLHLLGPPRLVAWDGREIHEVLRRPQLLGVLGYLAAARPRGFRERDELLALFWPELDDFRARRALRKVLFLLRRAIAPEAIPSRGKNQISVDRAVLWCDVPTFREALAKGDRREALELYRGEFLPAFHVRGSRDFGEWVRVLRRDLRRLAARAGLALAEEASREADPEGAVEWGRRAFALGSAYDEGSLRRFVKILDRCGRRAEAIEVYSAFATRLEEDLGIGPAPETRELIAAVRAG